ncbi:M14 family zinc carboxypeptidase [Dokdonella sp.]|uniref:M14 family zinc carboxypeptidase n=1 Tax=Dokdonella sp. TaxID=2291710 RepID=UPI003C69804C
MRTYLLASLLGLSIPVAALAEEWFVEARYPDAHALQLAGGQFQHLDIDPVRRTFRVDTDEDGIRFLRDMGMDVQIDMAATARLRAFYAASDSISSIPGYSCYRTVEETYASIDDMVLARPDLASVSEIGPTWERAQSASSGYMMKALRLTNMTTAASDPDRPRLVLFGSIHAREYTPAELLTRFSEWLVGGYGTHAQATWLLDHVDFRLILQANPDGRKKAETGQYWRKNTNTSNGTCGSGSPGIDLNRNFPFHWNGTSGIGSSGSACNETYRGPSSASEHETRNLVTYVAGTADAKGVYAGGALPDRKPDDVTVAAPDDYAGLFFDIHSYSQLVVWPWGDTRDPTENGLAMQTLGRRLAGYNEYLPAQSSDPNYLYTTDGTTTDTIYGLLGAPSFTIELGTSFFESCANFTADTLPKNLAALKYAARVARAPYQLPLGPDSRDLALDRIVVEAGEPVEISAIIDDTRYSSLNGTQQVFDIQSAQAFVDRAPWEIGALSQSLVAMDGAFDSPVEAVSGTISTTGLEPGRHIVYVQGKNASGAGDTKGAVDAIFLDIVADDTIFENGFEDGVR